MRTTALLLAVGLAAFALESASGGHPAARWAVSQLVLPLAIAGCWQAAAAFRRGDYMWRAWVATGSGFAVGFAVNLLGGPGDAWIAGRPWGPAVNLGAAVALNLAMLAGAWLFALAFVRGGLTAWVERPAHAALYAATAALAVVLGYPSLAEAVQSIAAGDAVGGAVNAVSIGTDVACFLAGAPLLRAALDLAGSGLARVWWLVGLANLSWLVGDAMTAFAGHGLRWRLAGHALLAVASVATFLAARGHARAVRETLRGEARAA